MEKSHVEIFAEIEADAEAVLLPPPPGPLLHFAVRGWADMDGTEIPPGHTVPSLNIWLPAFIRLLAIPDWMDQCRDYALRGAYLYGGENGDLLSCVARAFKRPDTAFRIVHEIARHAEAGWPGR